MSRCIYCCAAFVPGVLYTKCIYGGRNIEPSIVVSYLQNNRTLAVEIDRLIDR